MPSNFFKEKRDPSAENIVREQAAEKARFYFDEITNGTARWHAVPVLPEIMKAISHSKKIWEGLRKKYPLEIDEGLCTRCGLCSRICPVGNITVDGIPEIGERCEYCMRCFTYCPVQAIQVRGKKFIRYKAAGIENITSPL